MKKPFQVVFGVLFAALSSVAGMSAASAASGGQSGTATPLEWRTATLDPNVSYTISTSSLSSGADTVIHVQNADGSFLAGNDDFGGTFASSVTIPASSSARTVTIVVRAWSALSTGTATLQIVPSAGTAQTFPIVVSSGLIVPIGSYVANTRVTGVEVQQGTHDAAVLLLSGSSAHASSFDDDSGIELMPMLYAREACTAGCTLIIGSHPQEGNKPVRVYWDETWMNQDSDNDGLGLSLEVALGTDPAKRDSDGDGLEDGVEVYGYPSYFAETLNRYPYFGADPKQKDVFTEVDWEQCFPVESTKCRTSSGSYDPDKYRMTGAEAELVTSIYSNVGLSVHLDIGVAPPNSSVSYNYGNWSPPFSPTQGTVNDGARSVPDDPRSLCIGRNYYRAYFHSAVKTEALGGLAFIGGPSAEGLCLYAGDKYSFTHELGHNLTLDHGGDEGLNFKVNYPSLMNYAASNSWGKFSHGPVENRTPTLNGARISEESGFDGASQDVLDFAATGPKYVADAYGQIDWNRDGAIQSGNVRAPLFFTPQGTGDNFRSEFSTDDFAPGAALAWRNGAPPTLYWIERTSQNVPTYRTALRPTCTACEFAWSSRYLIPTLAATTLPLGAVSFDASGSNIPHLVVFEVTASGLEFTVFNGSNWSPRQLLGAAESAPTAAFWDGKLWVFSTVAGNVRSWTYTPSTNVWAGPTSDTVGITALSSSTAVGLVAGAVKNGTASPALVLATTSVITAPPLGSSSLKISMFYRTPGSSWQALPGLLSSTLKDLSTGLAPAIGYASFDPASPLDGRFYIVATGDVSSDGLTNGMVHMTEGNDISPTATTRRFRRAQTAPLGSSLDTLSGPVGVSSDLRYETSVRGAWCGQHNRAVGCTFRPFVDGVVDIPLHDWNDYASLLLGACRAFGGSVPCP